MNVLPSWLFVSLDAFLHVLQDPKTECRKERGAAWSCLFKGRITPLPDESNPYSQSAWSYSCQMWILIWAGFWHWLAISIFWHDILHNGSDANLRILKWKRVILSVGSFSWTGCLQLIKCTKKENFRYFRKDFIQFCTVYQQKGGDVNKAQLHGCLSSKNYIFSF